MHTPAALAAHHTHKERLDGSDALVGVELQHLAQQVDSVLRQLHSTTHHSTAQHGKAWLVIGAVYEGMQIDAAVQR